MRTTRKYAIVIIFSLLGLILAKLTFDFYMKPAENMYNCTNSQLDFLDRQSGWLTTWASLYATQHFPEYVVEKDWLKFSDCIVTNRSKEQENFKETMSIYIGCNGIVQIGLHYNCDDNSCSGYRVLGETDISKLLK